MSIEVYFQLRERFINCEQSCLTFLSKSQSNIIQTFQSKIVTQLTIAKIGGEKLKDRLTNNSEPLAACDDTWEVIESSLHRGGVKLNR